MKKYIIASFYKFIELPHYESLKSNLLNTFAKYHILGTIILAKEGINGSFAGSRENIRDFYNELRTIPELNDLRFKETYEDFIPFARAKVKLRKEIVTMGVDSIETIKNTGEHVHPEDWNDLISDPNVLFIDTRNEYEIQLGTFKHAVNPHTQHFRDFPGYVQKHLLDKKDRPIAMCCTGGVRCEKSTAYLKQLGFEKVYQLDGGILNYLDTVSQEESLWEGTCFVFDDRIAIEPQEEDSTSRTTA